jgi:hypothetical protein
MGLARRHIYSASAPALMESLQLPRRPDGHDELCALMFEGKLNQPNQVMQVLERYWRGVVEWAVAEPIDLSRCTKWPF